MTVSVLTGPRVPGRPAPSVRHQPRCRLLGRRAAGPPIGPADGGGADLAALRDGAHHLPSSQSCRSADLPPARRPDGRVPPQGSSHAARPALRDAAGFGLAKSGWRTRPAMLSSRAARPRPRLRRCLRTGARRGTSTGAQQRACAAQLSPSRFGLDAVFDVLHRRSQPFPADRTGYSEPPSVVSLLAGTASLRGS